MADSQRSSEVCEICASQALFFADISGFGHFRCASCKHLFVYPPPTPEILERFYSGGSYYDSALAQAARLTVEANQRLELLERLSAQQGLPRRLLDVGSAAGLFLSAARRRGWEATGVERSPVMAARAAECSDARVVLGIFESMEVLGAPFPVVTAWEVLEHAIAPVAFFAALARATADGGLLALSTPRSDGIPARLLGRRFPMICPPEHLNLFSRESLRLLARREGLTEIAYSSFSNLSAASLGSGFSRLLFDRDISSVHPLQRRLLQAAGFALSWVPGLIDKVGLGTEMQVVFVKRER